MAQRVRDRRNDERRSDPTLKLFVDAVRGLLDLEPLYVKPKRTELERFYVAPMEPMS
jgi:hypothetical protein